MAFFKADDVHIEGKTASFPVTAESGNIVTRHFCPTCGSRILSKNTGRPGLLGIAVGCADNSDWFTPQAVVYTKSRADWDKTSVAVPNFEAGAPPPPK